MRFHGNAPLYSAFALVAIESVWPNPEGGELSPDSYDLGLLGMGEGSEGGNASAPRKSFSTGYNSVGEYEKSQGYYKIFPLNIMSVSTTTTVPGIGADSKSSFDVKFTLNDLLLVTDKDNLDAISNATGLPMDRVELVHGDLPEFPDTLSLLSNPGVKAVTDEDLGVARFRISGPNSGFNIEDLVTPNDTVTIWFYHDPKDFYFKDGKQEIGNDGNVIEDDLTVNKGLSWVIGSGDRRGQYSVDVPSFKETVLGAVGLISEYNVATMEAVLSDLPETRVKGVTKENLADIFNSFLQESVAGSSFTERASKLDTDGNDIEGRMEKYTKQMFGDDIGHFIYEFLMKPMTSKDYEVKDGWNIEVVNRKRKEMLRYFISKLEVSDSGELLLSDDEQTVMEAASMGTGTAGYLEFFDLLGQPSTIVNGLNLFVASMNKELSDYLGASNTHLDSEGRRSKHLVTKTRQNFSNGRTIITSGAEKPTHGETPYLVLRGQISTVKTAVGSAQGAYTVTISGGGMEKIINEHEVFYESIYAADYMAKLQADYKSFFVYMSPPRAILAIVNRWAPKKILFGKPSSYYIDAANKLWVQSKGYKYKDLPDNKESIIAIDVDHLDLEEEVPIRGNVVMSEAIMARGEVDKSKLRVFSPVNYVDTTRIREMISVLDKSYTIPEQQAVINTSVMLSPGESIYSNLKRVVGVGAFYQVFVDETGRIRYRLTFEGMDRTPQPLYTPIIQDIDMLGEGASFEQSDAELKTMIDVRPLTGDGATARMGLAFMGRSVPEAGEVPLINLPPEAPPETIAPDFFRYGMRSQRTEDIYTSQPREAQRKAIIYRDFFSKPLKQANLRVRGNPAFRAGETVLVSLQNSKYRARTPVDIDKLISWLEGMDRDSMDMYIGVDERLLHPEYYEKTTGFEPIPGVSSTAFRTDPKDFVRRAIVSTLLFIKNSAPGVSVITPEYFPTTYWYFTQGDPPDGSGTFRGWDENAVLPSDVVDTYSALLSSALTGDRGAADTLNAIYQKRTAAGVMNAIRFQDFRVTSYLIERVSHTFTQDTEATTALSLNFGQDNLILLEPRNFLPVGFLSLEKKMRIGWESKIQRDVMYETYSDTPGASVLSPLQNMFVEQFKEDQLFKKGNFLYNAQGFRNTSNYMYDIALMEGLESTTSTEEATKEVFNEVVVSPTPDMERVNEVVQQYKADAIFMKKAKGISFPDRDLPASFENKDALGIYRPPQPGDYGNLFGAVDQKMWDETKKVPEESEE
ncbi:MAG: hypothetical protein WC965_01900 [Thiohalomonadaceae bacterium]